MNARLPLPARALFAVAAAIAAAVPVLFGAHALTAVGGPQFLTWMATWGTPIAYAACTAMIGIRLVCVRHDRAVWACFAAAGLLWTLANSYYAFFVAPEPAPLPSPQDVGYVLFPIALMLGLAHSVRARGLRFSADLWLDGLVAGLGVAAAATAVVFSLVHGSDDNLPSIVTTLVYPVLDVVLLGTAAGVGSLLAWRVGRVGWLLGGGILAITFADGLVFGDVLAGNAAYSAATDLAWTAGLGAIALAAWQPVPEVAKAGGKRRDLVLPVVFAPLALAILGLDGPLGLAPVATIPAAAALGLACVRLYRAFREVQALADSRRLALTDDLTGLANRRRLMGDLAAVTEQASPRLLALFDLDGFKDFNDTHGHPEGDALLQRLATRMAGVVRGHGQVYRLGGDEFCVVTAPGQAGRAVIARASEALHERGPEWAVRASCGVVELPLEARGVTEAMGIADRRMYAQKARRPAAARRQAGDVLLTALGEQQPALHAHVGDVTALVGHVAAALGMEPDDVDDVVRAAELHDVGKLAIPREILDKPGPLDDAEWKIVRRHTIIGERMLSAAPAMAAIAPLVRSSHERWDGRGYPDGLAGTAIPLGARIVAVCDSFDAMVSDRVYRRGMQPAEALDELRRCAGTQFDPAVVEAFAGIAGEALGIAPAVEAQGAMADIRPLRAVPSR